MHKKYKKSKAIWCNDCDMVFDLLLDAEEHAKKLGHEIKVIEFLCEE
jgi:hypothetical protein